MTTMQKHYTEMSPNEKLAVQKRSIARDLKAIEQECSILRSYLEDNNARDEYVGPENLSIIHTRIFSCIKSMATAKSLADQIYAREP